MNPRVAIVGDFQAGKSTLVCCLLNGRMATLGEGLPTTRFPTLYRFDQGNFVVGHSPEKMLFETSLEDFLTGRPGDRWTHAVQATVSLYNPLLQKVDIVDTPGVGGDEGLEAAAREAAREADLVLLLMTKGFPAGREAFNRFLRSALSGKRYGLILNCGLESPGNPRSQACVRIAQDVRAGLERAGLGPPDLAYRVNLGRMYREVLCPLTDEGVKKVPTLTVLRDCGFDGLRAALVRQAKKASVRPRGGQIRQKVPGAYSLGKLWPVASRRSR